MLTFSNKPFDFYFSNFVLAAVVDVISMENIANVIHWVPSVQPVFRSDESRIRFRYTFSLRQFFVIFIVCCLTIAVWHLIRCQKWIHAKIWNRHFFSSFPWSFDKNSIKFNHKKNIFKYFLFSSSLVCPFGNSFSEENKKIEEKIIHPCNQSEL